MIIDLSDIHFSFPGTKEKAVLNIPSWSLESREQVFIHGPSGGGKSTLLNLLSGMLIPSRGEVSVLGQRLDKMSLRQRDRFRAQHIGYVFQQFNLIPYLSAIENISLAAHFGKKLKSNIKKEAEGLLQKLNVEPDDWFKQANKLSIGQQQRVAIARALVNTPELLIADEPTSSLDQQNRDNFMSVLLSLAAENDIAVVFVSHDMSLSSHFERVDAMAEINRVGGDS